MTLPRISISLLLALLALAVPAAASAHIYSLSRATPCGFVLYGYADGGIAANCVASPHPFRVTFAYDTVRRSVVFGCRGRGFANVTVSVAGRRARGRCRNTRRWTALVQNIAPRTAVHALVIFSESAA